MQLAGGANAAKEYGDPSARKKRGSQDDRGREAPLAVSVGVRLLAGAFESDLILGYLAALLDGGGLGDAFGLGFVGLLHGLPRINLWMAVDWGDHSALL